MPIVNIYKIIRSHRSSVSIEITKEGKLIARAPFLMPDFLIKRFVKQKESWIRKHLDKKPFSSPINKQYLEGEEFLYLGNNYILKIGNFKEIMFSKDGFLYFPSFLNFRIKKELKNYYFKKAKEIILERLKYFSLLMKVSHKAVRFSDTSSKWGTCMKNNDLQFNFRLIMAPILVIDYVVVHELAHTLEKNHSYHFWKIVENYKPAYRQYRKWLRINQHKLKI